MLLLHVESANRIVDIADDLRTKALEPHVRERLQAEQRHLWDDLFPATPFEVIANAAVKTSEKKRVVLH